MNALALLIALCSSSCTTPVQSDVSFLGKAGKLVGTISIPQTGGRHPGVVLVAGSGPSRRSMLEPFAKHFQELGFVTLVFDKRGCGGSDGDWTSASLDDLADDASTAFTYLLSRPEIEPSKVGVWGVSQAGWVVPRMIGRISNPAFAVVLTGGGMTPREVEMVGYRNSLKRLGADAEGTTRAESLIKKYLDWLSSGIGRDSLVADIARAKSEPWYQAVNLEGVLPSEAARPQWEWVAKYDPLPDIAKMKLPVLVVLGAKDTLGDAKRSSEGWRKGLETAGNKQFRIEVIEEMGHAGRVGMGHGPENPMSTQYVQLLQNWVAELIYHGGIE